MTIAEIRQQISELTKENVFIKDGDIDKDIDIDNLASVLANFWNESVESCLDELKDKFNLSEDDLEKIFVNAGESFSDVNNCVRPFYNNEDVDYLSARTDENESVLDNGDDLDFTNKAPIIGAPKAKFFTRLIMPMNKRGVEIEDLNRNFWVIGQNLEFLNQFWGDRFDGLMNGVIAELMGIWNNVYKIWEALEDFEKELKDYRSDEKVRITIDCLNKVNGNDISTSTGHFNSYSINNVIDNILLEGENAINSKQAISMQKFLKDRLSSGIIVIDPLSTNRDLKEVLEEVKQLNLYVIGKDSYYDVFSVISKVTLENTTGLSLTFYNKVKKLWIDFVENDEIRKFCTVTQLNYLLDNEKPLYDVNISIPILNDETIGEHKYEDLIRINKPFPKLEDIVFDNMNEHITSLNNEMNYVTDDNDNLVCQLSGINFTSIKTMDFASSDMISSEHESGGQTKKDNKHLELVHPAYNVRYINGRGPNAQVEIITTKDQTNTPIKINPSLTPLNFNMGRIVRLSDDTLTENYLQLYTTETDANYSELNAHWANTALNGTGDTDANYIKNYSIIIEDKTQQYNSSIFIKLRNEDIIVSNSDINSLDMKKLWNHSFNGIQVRELTKRFIQQVANDRYSFFKEGNIKFILNIIATAPIKKSNAVTFGSDRNHIGFFNVIYKKIGGEKIETLPLTYIDYAPTAEAGPLYLKTKAAIEEKGFSNMIPTDSAAASIQEGYSIDRAYSPYGSGGDGYILFNTSIDNNFLYRSTKVNFFSTGLCHYRSSNAYTQAVYQQIKAEVKNGELVASCNVTRVNTYPKPHYNYCKGLNISLEKDGVEYYHRDATEEEEGIDSYVYLGDSIEKWDGTGTGPNGSATPFKDYQTLAEEHPDIVNSMWAMHWIKENRTIEGEEYEVIFYKPEKILNVESNGIFLTDNSSPYAFDPVDGKYVKGLNDW